MGRIDNLFVSPSGLLTIVETKLWRNPEAHKTVVAQVLGYARSLSKWTYGELDDSVKGSLQEYGGKEASIYEAVRRRYPDFEVDELGFRDAVEGCLSSGMFALLIVGDRVSPGATQLAEVIGATPALQYTLSFVEIRCYRHDPGKDWPLVVVPTVVKTVRDEVRAVVRVIHVPKKPASQKGFSV
jgi:hypothetical protein